MDSSPENRKLNKDSLISDISYQKKRRLCRLLDVRDDWKKIAGHIKSYVGERPRYDELTIQMIEREGLIPRGSPTECLLRDWRSIRPKISELLDVLILAKLKNVADYVSEAILLEGKVIMPIRPPSSEPPSVDPSIWEIIKEAATRHKLRIYSSHELQQYTDMFNDELLDNGGRLLGKGGYGNVYLGMNLSLTGGEMVAVKRFHESSLRELTTLQSELDAIFMNFIHPNLLPIYGVCHQSHFCVLYEYMVEGTLDDHLGENRQKVFSAPLNSEQRMDIAIDVARGIEHLHNLTPNALVHRDVKPSNILLGKDFNAKLGDFGLIRVQSIEEDGRDTNETQDVQGTTLYMPPEAMNGKVSTKWDIYSFGVVLLEILFAKGPGYTHEDGYTEKIIEAVFDEEIFEALPLHMLDSDCDWNEDIARQLLQLVEKCGMRWNKRPPISGCDEAVLETLLKLKKLM